MKKERTEIGWRQRQEQKRGQGFANFDAGPFTRYSPKQTVQILPQLIENLKQLKTNQGINL